MRTLVFIHGAGCTGGVFAAQTSAFAGSQALTLPGHATPGEPESIAEMADAVADALRERGIDDAILVGNSMGGAIALELALRHEPWLRAVALVGSGAKLRVSAAIFDAIRADFPAAVTMLTGYFFAEPREDLAGPIAAEMLRVGREQTLRDFAACDGFDVSARLGEIDIPVMALTGERDVMTPPKFAALLADRIPGGISRILPGAGHLAMVERPNETNEALRAFVTTIVAA